MQQRRHELVERQVHEHASFADVLHVTSAGAVGWIRYRLKSNPRTPTVFFTRSPPRKRFVSENGLPFGWRRTFGFETPSPSSSVIRRSVFASMRAFAAAPGVSIAVGVIALVSPSSGSASTVSPNWS